MFPSQSSKSERLKKGWKFLNSHLKSTPQPFDYAQIPLESAREARFIELFAAGEDDDLEIDFVAADVKKDHNYSILSYVWGDPTFCRTVFVKGYPRYMLNITVSLDDALRAMRKTISKGKSIFMWCDAICINQKDNDEKSQQIPLMPILYPNAKMTYCWLGKADEATERVFSWFQIVSNAIDMDEHKAVNDCVLQLRDELHTGTQPLIDGLQRLLAKPWFERAWILQEACRIDDKNIYIVQDQYNIHLIMIAKVIIAIHEGLTGNESAHVFGEAAVGALVAFAIATTRREDLTFSLLVNAMAHRKATVSHDKLYALLGLLQHPEVYPDPNYKMSLTEVCTQYTRAAMQDENSLDVLKFVTPSSNDGPSWRLNVNDLPRIGLQGTDKVRSATTNSFPAFRGEQTLSDPTLRLRGQNLGVVASVLKVMELTDHLRAHDKQWTDLVETLRIIRRKLQLTDQYPTSQEHINDAIALTMTGDDAFTLRKRSRNQGKDNTDAYYIVYRTAMAAEAEQGTIMSEEQVMVWVETVMKFPAESVSRPASLPEPIESALSKRALLIYMSAVSDGCNLFATADGMLGSTKAQIKIGDQIALLPGSSSPLALRPRPGAQGEWRYVGQTYLHGAMTGSAYREAALQDIDLV